MRLRFQCLSFFLFLLTNYKSKNKSAFVFRQSKKEFWATAIRAWLGSCYACSSFATHDSRRFCRFRSASRLAYAPSSARIFCRFCFASLSASAPSSARRFCRFRSASAPLPLRFRSASAVFAAAHRRRKHALRRTPVACAVTHSLHTPQLVARQPAHRSHGRRFTAAVGAGGGSGASAAATQLLHFALDKFVALAEKHAHGAAAERA